MSTQWQADSQNEWLTARVLSGVGLTEIPYYLDLSRVSEADGM